MARPTEPRRKGSSILEASWVEGRWRNNSQTREMSRATIVDVQSSTNAEGNGNESGGGWGIKNTDAPAIEQKDGQETRGGK